MGLRAGDKLDRYLIETLLGEGGMGSVYRAYDERLHRHVALKVLRGDRAIDPNASADGAARLLREARAVAALDHPNAVAVYDTGEVDEAIYIAMEFVDGTPLRSFVAPGSASSAQRLRWLLDVARALEAAHARGLVHRDVKPENVLVRKDGVIKVLDFGIAKRLEMRSVSPSAETIGPADTTQTAAGTLVGTPRYMSPEQVRGDAIDGRSDQFSWGVMAYELLTGDIPWKNASDGMKLFAAVLTQDVPELDVDGLPLEVGAIVARALEKSQSRRFPSMTSVVAALEPLVHNSTSLPRIALGNISTRTDVSSLEPSHATTRKAATPLPRDTTWTARVAWAGAGLLGIAAVALAARTTVLGTAAPAPSASLSVAPPPAASSALVPIGKRPLPIAVKPDALAAFRAGLLAFRDASFDATRQNYERAATLDPSFGAAHLRLALMNSLVSADEQDARRAFRSATQFRSTMDERDQRLLDGMEPYFQREPSDLTEAERRMTKVADDFPGDAELWFWLGFVRFDHGQLRVALEAFARASAIDPDFALAFSNQGGIQAYLGRFDEAKKSLERCLSISSSATDCLWYRVLIAEQEGRCADADADLRRWIAKDGEDFYAYQMLAKILYAEGKPSETVMEAYEQKWTRLSAARRARSELTDRARVDIISGHFEQAEKRLFELSKEVAHESGALAHATPAMMLVDLYAETGQTEKLKRTANEFLKKRGAWSEPHRVDDRAISEDATLFLESALVKAGAMPESDLRVAQTAWISGWKTRTTESYLNYLWVYGYALPTATKEGADAALAALPELGPLPPFLPQTLSIAHVGKTYALAKRWTEALPMLRAAAASCMALEEPFLHTQSELVLGQALEETGDVAGACAAYEVVLSRWGKAKPASASADRARSRKSALRCAK